jgi:hypothetical protein
MRFSRLTLLGTLASLGFEKGRFGAGRSLLWASALVLGAGLAACAGITPESSAAAKQKVVAERAEARWQLLMKGDVEGAYAFLSSGSKAATPFPVYKAKMKPGLWRQAKVDKVSCEAEICKVEMKITYDYRNMKGIETPLPETWIVENGSAWYVYR